MARTPTVGGCMVVAAMAAGSCGSADDSSDGSAGASSSADYCGDSLDRLVACEQAPTDPQQYLEDCADFITCYNTLYVPAFVDAKMTCANTRPCSAMGAEGCGDDVIEQQRADPALAALYDQCMARYDECCANGSCSFNESHCSAMLVEQEVVRSGDAACLAQACDLIRDCFDDVAAELGMKAGCAPS